MAEPHVTKTFRFPTELTDELMQRSRHNMMSLNAFVVHTLEAAMAGDDRPLALEPEAAFGFLRLTFGPANLIDAMDGGAVHHLGRLIHRPWQALKGPGTNLQAWDDITESLQRRTSFDAQIVVYCPTEPDSPIFVAVECVPKGGYAYMRLRRTTQGGQWCRRRLLAIDIPAELTAPEPASFRVAETHEP